jgi:hypothetical protein
MLQNLWSGAVYAKSVDYLLRFLLRCWLAPNREQTNKERARKFTETKKAIAQERCAKKAGRLAPSHWRHCVKRILDGLADCEIRLNQDCEGEAPQESVVRRQATLLHALKVLDIKRPTPDTCDQQPPLSMDCLVEAGLELDDDDDDDGQWEIERLMSIVEEENSQDALDDQGSPPSYGPTSQETNTSPTSLQPAPTTQKEPDRRHLRALQTLLKILIESPSPNQQYTFQQVESTAFKDHKFTDAELEVVRNLANSLRPFTPRRWRSDGEEGYRAHTPHVALRSPIVILANAVCRATGHSDFARRIAPHVSTGDVHALHLGPAQLFETLCSAEEDHFDVKDIYGNILTNVGNVTSPKGNMDAIFNAFFNVPRIREICRAHGTHFVNR